MHNFLIFFLLSGKYCMENQKELKYVSPSLAWIIAQEGEDICKL